MDTIFDLCVPKSDVLEGNMRDDFAADLSRVIRGDGPEHYQDYSDPRTFFHNTYPTNGLKFLLKTVCRRLKDTGEEISPVIRLDTQYGGGKTHALIALVHTLRGMKGVDNIDEFIDPALLPTSKVRIAALDGELSDPTNGRQLDGDIKAFSMWGEMAYQLAGKLGYELVRKSDEAHIAPGAETIRTLFGDDPTVILIDEVSVYLRKAAKAFGDGANQFTAFMHALIKAVAATPRVALVTTLALKHDEHVDAAVDAYADEQLVVNAVFKEVEQISARKLQPINPTEDDETVSVLRRRLFSSIDFEKANTVIAQYFDLWEKNNELLCDDARTTENREQFLNGYPFHPELIAVMTKKMSSLANFQKTRGMLRLLARTIRFLWDEKPPDAFAIHAHHMDLSRGLLREEILSRLTQSRYETALSTDVDASQGMVPSTSKRIDDKEHIGLPPITKYLARTVFLHTMAAEENAQGIEPDRLRYAVASPSIDPSIVEQARKRFIEESLYLDDRPGARLRFHIEANLNQVILKAMKDVGEDEIREQLQSNIRKIFTQSAGVFEIVLFPSGGYSISDEVGNGKPYLAVLNYEAHAVSSSQGDFPSDLLAMARFRSANEQPRLLRNNIVFVAADERRVREMRDKMRRRIALNNLAYGPELRSLQEHQQRKVREEEEKSRTALAISILQCYRHLYYPSASPVGGEHSFLGHTTVEIPSTSDQPGNGQEYIRRALRDQSKLLTDTDTPNSPAYIRDHTPLKTKGALSTQALRNEYRCAPSLSILIGDTPFREAVKRGIEQGQFIYRKGDQVWGKGDPMPSIILSEDCYVHTMSDAQRQGLWPRAAQPPVTNPDKKPDIMPDDGGGEDMNPAPPHPKALVASGALKAALTQIFSSARKEEIPVITSMEIAFYDKAGFEALHPSLIMGSGMQVSVHFDIQIEADGIRNLSIAFEGDHAKANSVKSWAIQQLQLAVDYTVGGSYRVMFEPAISTEQSASNTFIAMVTKHGSPPVGVTALPGKESSDD